MNDLELIFNMLAERVTTEITKVKDAKEFDKCSKRCRAKDRKNYLVEPEKMKRKRIQ